MFGAAQLPVNHKTEDIIITVAPFFSNNWRLLMDEKSESFTLMELWIKLIYKEQLYHTAAFPQLVLAMHLNNIALLGF